MFKFNSAKFGVYGLLKELLSQYLLHIGFFISQINKPNLNLEFPFGIKLESSIYSALHFIHLLVLASGK